MSSVPQSRFTAQQYLEIERKAEIRSEFYRGEMFAMAGASRRHNLICTNLIRRLAEQFDDRDCEVYQGDMRVKISRTGLYVYPDVIVACENPQFEDENSDVLLNPRVLIEVLSKSTEGYDRGTKWRHYQKLASLRDYILISQQSPSVERFRRGDDHSWIYSFQYEPNDTVQIDSIDCTLRLGDTYAKVNFDEPSEEDDQV